MRVKTDLGAILGMTTVILVMAVGQTRIIFAMSRDGLLPKRLSTVHPRFHTPFFATWLVGIVFGLIAAVIPLNILGAGRDPVRGPDDFPQLGHLGGLFHLAGDRPGHLLRLRTPPFAAAPATVIPSLRPAQ